MAPTLRALLALLLLLPQVAARAKRGHDAFLTGQAGSGAFLPREGHDAFLTGQAGSGAFLPGEGHDAFLTGQAGSGAFLPREGHDAFLTGQAGSGAFLPREGHDAFLPGQAGSGAFLPREGVPRASEPPPPPQSGAEATVKEASEAVVGPSEGLKSSMVGIGAVMLESVQVSKDAVGATLAAIGCILVCLPIVIGALIGLCRDLGREGVSEKEEDPFFTELPPAAPPQPPKPSARSSMPREQPPRSPPSARLQLAQQQAPPLVAPRPIHPLPTLAFSLASRQQEAESSASSDTGHGPQEALRLCEGLVIRKPGGTTLRLIGFCAPYCQDEVLEVKQNDGGRECLARAVISEQPGGGGGVIIESSFGRLPIVFMHTHNAVADKDEDPPEDRHIVVSTASTQQGDGSHPPICVFRPDVAGEGFIARRGLSHEDPLVLAVRVPAVGHIKNVLDPEGKLLGTIEVHPPEAGVRDVCFMHIAEGVDATIIIAAVIASQKLR